MTRKPHPTPAVKARYHDAIEWIAFNDEDAEHDTDVVAQQMTVILVADVFDVDADQVALDVVKIRERELRRVEGR